MGAMKTGELPARLVGVQRRFERWRRMRAVRSRIPEPLWAAAVLMGELYGIHRTAKALRLDYYSMKKRIAAKAAAAGKVPLVPTAATFLELAPSPRGDMCDSGMCECTVECEDSSGAKMRIHLSGVATPDLAALSRSFWRAEP
jgi:hypothetical protein